MLNIGTHLSVAKGYERMGKDALLIGANTLQFFARNPRGVKAKAADYKDMNKFRELLQENDFARIMAHAPYTLNACSKDAHLRELSAQMFEEDISRMEFFPGNYYNLHPGSCLGQESGIAIEQIAHMLNKVMFEGMHTTVLLETMSGKGSEMGRSFEEIKAVMELVEVKESIGVCMDACHLWNAGYDLVNNLEGVLQEFDRIIGLKYLRAFHLNDTMDALGSHKDRHVTIGDGILGVETITSIINHPKLSDLIFILETPTELEGHRKEIELLKKARIN